MICPLKKYFVVNPFTSQRNFNYREWDINNYKVIAEYVKDSFDIDMVVVGGKSNYEIEMSKNLCCTTFIKNLVGKTNLQDLYNLIKKSEFYLGPDSGTLHIASMIGKNYRPLCDIQSLSNRAIQKYELYD